VILFIWICEAEPGRNSRKGRRSHLMPHNFYPRTTATAEVLWTGTNSDSLKAAPQLIEQGREPDELVKRNGR